MTHSEQSPADALAEWNRYRYHREMVTNMLIEGCEGVLGGAQPELMIWGAGRCFDVELQRLTQAFKRVRLVDITERLLDFAIANQGLSRATGIKCHDHTDLTGVSAMLESLASDEGSPRLSDIIEQARSFAGPETPATDVLVSNAMLSQLVNHVVETVGEDHPRFNDVALSIRNRHLDLLVEYTRPGGVAFLVTDVVSSETLPQLTADIGDIPRLLNEAIARQNFFHGTNPYAIVHYLQTRSPWRARLRTVKMSEPWIWDGPAELLRIVTAIRIQLAQ